MDAAWDIYAKRLMPRRLGYPLFQPDQPETHGGIQVGDVGFIEKGRFHPLFNVMNRDSPLNQKTSERFMAIPDGFEQLEISHDLYANNDSFLAPGFYASERTSVWSSELDSGVDSIGAGAKLKVQCSSQQGALLWLKDRGSQHGVCNTCTAFAEYARTHYHNWLGYFVNRNCDPSNGITMVTSVIKTSGWGLAAFNPGSAVEFELSLNVPTGIGTSIGAGVSFKRLDVQSIVPRAGPLGRTFEGTVAGSSQMSGFPLDQTVFINYLKIKRRFRFGPRYIEAAGSPDSDSNGSDDEYRDNLEIEPVPLETKDYDPVDELLDYIFDSTGADVAIANTTDMLDLINGEWPEDIRLNLNHREPKIHLNGDEEKFASFSIEDMIARRNASRFANAYTTETSGASPQRGCSSIANDRSKLLGLQSLFSGSLILARKLESITFGLDWPHRVFLEDVAQGVPITSMAVTPNGQLIAACYEDAIVRVWSWDTGVLIRRLALNGEIISCITWSSNGTKLICGGSRGVLWDLAQPDLPMAPTEPALLFNGHEDEVQAIAISPDDTRVATGSIDGVIKLWLMPSGENYVTIDEYSGMVTCIHFSPDGKTVQVAAAIESMIYIWVADTKSLTSSLKGHEGVIWTFTFDSNGARIVSGSEDHTARIWDTENGNELVVIREHLGPVWSAVFSPDNTEVLTGSDDGVVSACNSYTGQNRLLLADRPSVVNSATYSPSRHLIVAGCADGSLKLWSNLDGAFIAEIQGHKDKVKNVSFIPNSTNLVSSSDDGTIRAWDVVDILRVA